MSVRKPVSYTMRVEAVIVVCGMRLFIYKAFFGFFIRRVSSRA